jgi:hypothetical protein
MLKLVPEFVGQGGSRTRLTLRARKQRAAARADITASVTYGLVSTHAASVATPSNLTRTVASNENDYERALPP